MDKTRPVRDIPQTRFQERKLIRAICGFWHQYLGSASAQGQKRSSRKGEKHLDRLTREINSKTTVQGFPKDKTRKRSRD